LAIVGLLNGEWVFRLVRAELRLTLSLVKNSEQIGEARNDRAAQLLGRHWASERAAYCRSKVRAAIASVRLAQLRLFPKNSPKMDKVDEAHHQVIEIIGTP
jgi:hypothetical protein